jgi:hypothetical protein
MTVSATTITKTTYQLGFRKYANKNTKASTTVEMKTNIRLI